MPFSWKKKKTRCNRFSQLVADHLQSPKHGGSLVVETGFPTSLIDLYVRNRGRFRKSSVKEQRETDSPTPLSSCLPPLSSGLLIDSDNFTSSALTDSFVDSDNSFSGGLDDRIDEIIEEDVVVSVGVATSDCEIRSENFGKTEVESSTETAELNPVLVVVLKVLLMVVVVLGAKRFTTGITMSAFLLLLLELAGKLLLGRSSSVKLGVDSKTPSESSFKEVNNVKRFQENTTLGVCSGLLEIEEEVESKQENKSDKELEQVRMRHKSFQRATMKSRMRNLVSKKLRKLSLGSKEISSGFIEEELKSAQDFKTRVLKQNEDGIAGIEVRSLSSNLSSEIDCNSEELGWGLNQNCGCLVLCLIVLIGLIGGRVLALVLASSWCLMLSKLQWRNVKFPIS